MTTIIRLLADPAVQATALMIAWAILGGLWRRGFGGWLGWSRSIWYGLSLPLSAPIWLVMPWSSHWWPYQALGCLAAAVLLLLFFVVSLAPGTKFVNMQALLKYGPFGAGYWFARLWWPKTWRLGGFLDGENAVGEIDLGASVYGCVGIAWYWVLQ